MNEDLCTIVCLSTEIGRGHPSYLDSIFFALRENYGRKLRLEYWTIFQESRGPSLLAWKLVKSLYAVGGKGGPATKIYNLLRSHQSDIQKETIGLRILGRDLKKSFTNSTAICVVAHPLVAKILVQVCRVLYIHGEIAAPGECAIRGVEKIFVPLSETRDKLVSAGADASRIIVTGLVIEPDLVEHSKEAFQIRLKRFKSNDSLTIGFFTSGAYPLAHMEKIIAGVKSVVKHNMKAIVFSGVNQKAFHWMRSKIEGLRILEDMEDESIVEDWDVRLVARKNRQAETKRTVELLPKIDAFVAASHERTNWAVGLGTPLFVLFPLIGSFAPQNFEYAEKQGVVYPLVSMNEARILGELIHKFRKNGRLLKMAQHGFGVHKIDGARMTASHIFQRVIHKANQ